MYRINVNHGNSSIAVSTPPIIRLSKLNRQSLGSGSVVPKRELISNGQQYSEPLSSDPQTLSFKSGLSRKLSHAESFNGEQSPDNSVVVVHESKIFLFSI